MIKLQTDKDTLYFLFGLLQLVTGLSYSIGLGGFLIGTGLCSMALTFVQPPD